MFKRPDKPREKKQSLAAQVPEHLVAGGHILDKLSPTQQRIYTVRMAQDPPLKEREVAELLDLSTGAVGSHWRQIKEKLGFDPLLKWKEEGWIKAKGREEPDVINMRNVSPDVFVKLNEMSQERLLRRLYHHVDDVPADKIPKMISDLTGARALVKGEPTQILRVDQRENLHKLFPQIVRELEKRDLMIDGEGVRKVPKTIESEPVITDP